jgi:pimeloyl-ACP methyl ester carboxylesterase
MNPNGPDIRCLKISYSGHAYDIEYFIRPGEKGSVLFVHGLGGCKENFWQALQSKELSPYTLIAFDNPGTGGSSYYEDSLLNIDDLVEITSLVIEALVLDDLVLAGASMGGLVTLHYLTRPNSRNIRGYINIEGNLMPEDCLFSSKVVAHSLDHFEQTIYPTTIREMKAHGNAGYYVIANNLEMNTNIQSYYYYSFQTVAYSSTGELLQQFMALSLPKLFIHGDRNEKLSYLPKLRAAHVELRSIPESDHFVFYDNPLCLYQTIADFIKAHCLIH